MTPLVNAALANALRSRYALIRQIGEGGMATVYLAEDLRHDRKVAIKVLKSDLAAMLGAERFLAEIRTTASLQHPHILPLFDSGDAEGFLFYVMPYVEGESLRSRLDRETQLAVDEVIAITRAVATALDYAHRRGIVHRDIKPANILLQDGQPLISDFGIALAVSNAGGTRLTETGLSIGTPSYMSPEQAAGERTVDGRSDLYSLGCVAYEMLTGQPPFTAPTARGVVMRILADKPVPVSAVRPSVPPHVTGVVARSLEKVPADRFDSGAALARALTDGGFRWPPAVAVREGRREFRMLVAALGVAAGATALALWGWMRPLGSPSLSPEVRLMLSLPEDQYLPVDVTRSVLEISPRGTHLVYVGRQGRETQLYARDLGDFNARPLPATRGASEPFFSPDGEWVGFFADGKLRKVRIEGGIPIVICDAPGRSYGATWGEDGTIHYSLSGSSLWRVSADGGTPRELPLTIREGRDQKAGLTARAVTAPIKWPRLLPGGKHALATVGWVDENGRPNQAGLTGVVDVATGEFRTLFSGSRPYYVRTGHIVFDAGLENVRAVPFDLSRLAVTGPAVPVVDNALRSAGAGSNFTVSESGILAHPTGGFERTLVIVDRYGRESPLALAPRGFRFPRVSPDGRYVAVTVDPQPPHIWIIDLQRMRATPLTTDGYNLYADWSPDGTRLIFVRLDVDVPGVYQARWPAADELTLLLRREAALAPRWADDDHLFVRSDDGLRLLSLRTGTSDDLVPGRALEREPSPSPDGAWVAYSSNTTGIDEVFVLPFVRRSAPIPISSGGGTEPRWSADGKELFFRNGNTISSVRVRTSPTFEFTSGIEPLFSGRYDFSNESNWDVLPDGRFLMVKSAPYVGREIRLAFNWIERLDTRSK